MLSGFSSYLFGGNDDVLPPATTDDDSVTVMTVSAENNDWVFIENPGK